MRVAIVCPYDLSVPGGVQAQVVGLAEALGRTGAGVTVIAPLSAGNAAGVPRAYELIGVGKSLSIAANGSRAPVAPGPRAMSRTLSALRQERPDVVHIHEPLTPGSSLAALMSGPRPVVATFHRSGTDRIYRLEGAALRIFARRLDAAVAVSDAARQTAAKVLGRSFAGIPVIPNAVDLGRYAAARLSASPGGGHAIAARPGTILFVGRHEERKGLAVLLDAFELLRHRQSPGTPATLRLLVVGDGPQTAGLRARFGDGPAISWLGPVDDHEKMRLLTSADVFVAPSLRGESFGVVLLEAMAAGTAVVASGLEGYRLAAGEAALFVKVGDAEDLANGIEAVLGDTTERVRLVRLGGERVKGFSLDSLAERYLAVYESVSRSRHGS
jgi:phosphatidylinositol alpha-mannosyltransferase